MLIYVVRFVLYVRFVWRLISFVYRFATPCVCVCMFEHDSPTRSNVKWRHYFWRWFFVFISRCSYAYTRYYYGNCIYLNEYDGNDDGDNDNNKIVNRLKFVNGNYNSNYFLHVLASLHGRDRQGKTTTYDTTDEFAE